jgi:hypothetical protein
MYQTSLHFKLDTPAEKVKILELFFQDWADGICNKEVSYNTVESNSKHGCGAIWWDEVIRVDFKNSEDAVAMKLRGIPHELQNYLTIVDYK